MGQRLLYPGNIPDGSLAAALGAATTTSFTVLGWPATIGGSGLPFVVEIGPGLGDDEKVLVSGVSNGIATIAASGRGWDSTTATSHQAGEVCRIVWDATSAQDHTDHIYLTTRDDHTQYLTSTRHTGTGYAQHSGGQVKHGLIDGLTADDHAQYHTDARHDAHAHPAGAFAAATVARSVLVGGAGLLIGQVVELAGGLTGTLGNFLLACDGSAVSRTTYSALFSQIGVAYGAGDGATTFNVPDLRGMVVAGSSPVAIARNATSSNQVAATNQPEGNARGEESHVLVAAELTSHTHGVTDPGHGHTVADPTHTHTGMTVPGRNDGWMFFRDQSQNIEGLMLKQAGNAGQQGSPGTFTGAQASTQAAGTGVTVAANGTGITTAAAGSSAGHNTIQPTVAIPRFICYA